MIKKMRFIAAAVAVGLFAAAVVRAEGPAIGSKAPNFSLSDTNGKTHTLSDYKGRTVVLEWTNFGCPFVVKHYESGNMQSLQKKWAEKGIVWLSICSSAKGKEGHMTPSEWNKEIAGHKSASTAYLLDESGQVGKSYGAKTTPHMFIIDAKGSLVYKGAIDDKPTYKQSDVKGAHNHVDAALTDLAAGKPVQKSSTEPYGCSVKYQK